MRLRTRPFAIEQLSEARLRRERLHESSLDNLGLNEAVGIRVDPCPRHAPLDWLVFKAPARKNLTMHMGKHVGPEFDPGRETFLNDGAATGDAAHASQVNADPIDR